jgi:hypothetical protein
MVREYSQRGCQRNKKSGSHRILVCHSSYLIRIASLILGGFRTKGTVLPRIWNGAHS